MSKHYIVVVRDFGESYEYDHATLADAIRFMSVESLPCHLVIRNGEPQDIRFSVSGIRKPKAAKQTNRLFSFKAIFQA